MSTLLNTISVSKLKIRWEEPFLSEALNQALAANPTGIAFGFKPSPGGGLSLDLLIDTAFGASQLVVRDTTNNYAISYFELATVTLDLTAHASTTVYIGVGITYIQTVATLGEIRAYTQAEYNAGLTDIVLLCRVDVPAATIVDASINQSYRSPRWRESMAAGDQFWWGASVGTPHNPFPTEMKQYTQAVPSGWSLSVDNVRVSLGETSHRFTYVSGTSNPIATIGYVSVKAGSVVIVEGRRDLNGCTANNVGTSVTWYDSSRAFISISKSISDGPFTTQVTAFEDINSSFIAPANASIGIIGVGAEVFTAGEFSWEMIRAYCDDQNPERVGDVPVVPHRGYQGVELVSAINMNRSLLMSYSQNSFNLLPAGSAPSPLPMSVGTATKKIDQSINGNVDIVGTVDDFGYATTVIKEEFLTFEAYTDNQFGGSSSAVQNAPNGNLNLAWDGVIVQTGTGTAFHRLSVPVGAVIDTITVGIDNVADGGFKWDMAISVRDVTDGAAALVASVANLGRSTGTDIVTVTWSGIAYTVLSGEEFLLLEHINTGGAIHTVRWVRVKYTFNKVKTGLNWKQ